MHSIEWPSVCPRGVHLIVSGGCASPVTAVHGVADAYAKTRKETSNAPRVCVHHDLTKTLVEYHGQKGGNLTAKTCWHFRLDHPDLEAELAALDRDRRPVFHVYPDVTNTNLARDAFRRAYQGAHPVVGVTAPDALAAVEHLESIGVAPGYLLDSAFLSRIDVLKEDAPQLVLRETHFWPYRVRRTRWAQAAE